MNGYIGIDSELEFTVEKMNSIVENIIALFWDASNVSFRAVFRDLVWTLSNIYDGAFSRK